jgi:ribosomal protein L29
MAILKMKDIRNMQKKEREEKLKELRLALIQSNTSSKGGSKNKKEIKKTIARILTIQ